MGQILLIRHGQASFGAEDYDVLSETGWAQGRLLGRWLDEQGIKPTVLIRGGMRRHRETLEAISGTAGWNAQIPLVDSDWDEFDHLGIVAHFPTQSKENLDRKTFQRIFEQATERWIAGEGEGYPETFAEFSDRVRRALTAAALRAGQGETVVVVTSGGPIGLACAGLLDGDAAPTELGRLWSRFNTVTVNSSVTRVVVGPTGARLLTFNEHSHLGPDTLTYR